MFGLQITNISQVQMSNETIIFNCKHPFEQSSTSNIAHFKSEKLSSSLNGKSVRGDFSQNFYPLFNF